MPPIKRSAGSFCSLVVATTTGTSDSITSLPVAALGNGAEAYCLANASTYRYISTSTQTTLGDTFLAPLSGGGCWAKQDAQADYTQLVTGSGSFNGLVTAIGGSDNVWFALPSAANAYVATFGGTIWSVNTTTGVMTYLGPSGLKFLISGYASFSADAGGVVTVAEFTIGSNGTIIGTTADVPRAQRSTLNGDFSSQVSPTEFVNSFVALPSTGDNFQFVVRRLPSSSLNDFTFARYQCTITKA